MAGAVSIAGWISPEAAFAGLKFMPNQTNPKGELQVDTPPQAPVDDSVVTSPGAPPPAAEAPAADAPPATEAPTDPAGSPSWYSRIKKKKAADAAAEAQTREEKPIVGTENAEIAPSPGPTAPPKAPATGVAEPTEVVRDVAPQPSKAPPSMDALTSPATLPASELSARSQEPVETNLLFKQKGLTDSVSFDIGGLFEQDVNGPAIDAGYAVGWWWRPDLIASGFGRVTANFNGDYVFWMLTIGPQVRYLVTDRWAITATAGFAYSQGMSKVDTAHLPVPPQSDVLIARRGLLFGLQAAQLRWAKRDFGLGPTISANLGTQSERLVFMLLVGFTFQSGRPNYTGDVTLDN